MTGQVGSVRNIRVASGVLIWRAGRFPRRHACVER